MSSSHVAAAEAASANHKDVVNGVSQCLAGALSEHAKVVANDPVLALFHTHQHIRNKGAPEISDLKARYLQTLMGLRQVVAHAKVRPRVKEGISGLDWLLDKLNSWNHSLDVTLNNTTYTPIPKTTTPSRTRTQHDHSSSSSTTSTTSSPVTTSRSSLPHSTEKHHCGGRGVIPLVGAASKEENAADNVKTVDDRNNKRVGMRAASETCESALDADLLEGDIDVDEYALRLARMSSSPASAATTSAAADKFPDAGRFND